MMLRRGHWLLIVALVLLGAGGYWLWQKLEWVETRVPRALKGEARTNTLLVAQRMATRLGATATSANGFASVVPFIDPAAPATGRVLMLPTHRRTVNPARLEALQNWVRRGGTLVVVAHVLDEGKNPQSPGDALLQELGIRLMLTDEGRKEREKFREMAERKHFSDEPVTEDEEERRAREVEKNMEELRKLVPALGKERERCADQTVSGALAPRFPDGATLLVACVERRVRLETRAEPLWTLASSQGVHALTMGVGNGRITVLTGYGFMQNHYIEFDDHADLAAAVLGFNDGNGSGAPREILFVPREDVPGIVSLTWTHAWPVVVLLAMWIALALVRAGARFGPVFVRREWVRRSLAEHVLATGEFLWRHEQSTVLWRATLDATRRRVARTLPRESFAADEAWVAALAAKSGIDAAHLHALWIHPHPPDSNRFATTIATLNRLRNSL
jgi:hypothetical protein